MALSAVASLVLTARVCAAAAYPAPKEDNFVIKGFRFRSGETLPEVRLHYTTVGTPQKDAHGQIVNAVLILHGTGGSGKQFLQPQFAPELFGPGQPLDTARYFVILPDDIGHGGSSKPSDGLHARFPRYDYDDMVEAEYRLVHDGLGIRRLRLVMGTSMGCMHAWLWGEAYPDAMDALMPLACLPVQIAGRNRVWRHAVIDLIRSDPAWSHGDYAQQPATAVRAASYFLLIAGSDPLGWQQKYGTRDAADQFADESLKRRMPAVDANDLMYQLDSSRNYDPSPRLAQIKAPVLFINSADDFINPPELAIAEREIKRVVHGRFILLPINGETHGHGSHTIAKLWKRELAELLQQTAKR